MKTEETKNNNKEVKISKIEVDTLILKKELAFRISPEIVSPISKYF
jgi:hypothetical protein